MIKAVILIVISLAGNPVAAQVEKPGYQAIFDSTGELFYINLLDTAGYRNMQPGVKVDKFNEDLKTIGYYRYSASHPYNRVFMTVKE